MKRNIAWFLRWFVLYVILAAAIVVFAVSCLGESQAACTTDTECGCIEDCLD